MKNLESKLNELPQPPQTQRGWPWTEEVNVDLYNTEINYPRITIVTPSYNQGQYIEGTIRSVLLQNYPNLEYIIIDGGSDDKTVEIIQKYAKWITYWVSEKDKGQSDALRKGFQKSTGDILCWLNSDDTFERNTLARIAHWSASLKAPYIITGYCRFVDLHKIVWEPPVEKNISLIQKKYEAKDLLRCWKNSLAQPSTFWSKEMFQQIGNIDDTLFFAMDLEYWLRAIKHGVSIYFVPEVYSNFLYHDDSKSISSEQRLFKDLETLSAKYIEDELEYRKFLKELKVYTNSVYLIKKSNAIASTERIAAVNLLCKGIANHWNSFFTEHKIIRNTVLKILFLK
jgi:glycosyltransferase involved in cell wall biosynthesis